jgi:AbiV family abortive infection protein
MSSIGSQTDERSPLPEFDDLVNAIVDKKVSVIDLLQSCPYGDYTAFVQRQRMFHALTEDRRVVERFLEEARSRMVGAGVNPDDDELAARIGRRDGFRRFERLVGERRKPRASLLNGATFEACLEQYRHLVAHVEKMWGEACQLYLAGSFPLSAFVSILVLEETGKLNSVAQDLVFWDVPHAETPDLTVDRNHRRKHFLAVVSGALINRRLDRILGETAIRRLLDEVESGELERIRQRCLYIDMQGGRTVTPRDLIDMEQAKILTTLAGELVAEVLGYFPWDFERMLESVIAFERAIGMPESAIARQ